MNNAPLMSTIVAVGLIFVAFFYVHAFFSGKRKSKYHRLSGILAVSLDLILSLGYMLYRSFGGKVSGHTFSLSGGILAFFIAHGVISLIVIILEVIVLLTGILIMLRKGSNEKHLMYSKILFPIWWLAFLSGELIYIVSYII